MKNDLLYVYGIAKKLIPPVPGLDSMNIESLGFGRFYAVIRYISLSEYSGAGFRKNISDETLSESNSHQHEKVLAMIMEHTAVIPFRPGTMFSTSLALGEFIAEHSDSLGENLEYVEGREEWIVQVYCNRKTMSEQIDELSPRAADLEKQVMASMPAKALLLRRKKTDFVETEMDHICKCYAREYLEKFRDISTSSSLSNILPKEFTCHPDAMVLNAVFLVDSNKANEFNWLANSLGKKDRSTGFNITIIIYLGP